MSKEKMEDIILACLNAMELLETKLRATTAALEFAAKLNQGVLPQRYIAQFAQQPATQEKYRAIREEVSQRLAEGNLDLEEFAKRLRRIDVQDSEKD
jgi:hypothetical protein